MAVTVVEASGIENIQLHINTLGDQESRDAYREALKKHFEPVLSQLCHDCQHILTRIHCVSLIARLIKIT